MTAIQMPSTISLRNYSGPDDLAAIAALINHCHTVDQFETTVTTQELKQALEDPDTNPEQDILLGFSPAGELVACGKMWFPPKEKETVGGLALHIHPQHRGQNLETSFLAWAEDRIKTVGKARQTQVVKLRSPVRDSQRDRLQFLTANGFTPERYFDRMQRSLRDPILPVQLPPGFSIRRVNHQQEAEAWVDMFNQSFIDHWDFHPLTVEEFLRDVNQPDYQPELDLVAVAEDGTLAAFCDCRINPGDRTEQHTPGWIAILGTRRGYRRIGLGRAMLLAGLEALKDAGANIALLGVDKQNPSQAFRLYESVGFTIQMTNTVFCKYL